MAWKGAKKVGVALRIMHVWYIGTSVFIHVSYFAYNDIRYMINTILYIYTCAVYISDIVYYCVFGYICLYMWFITVQTNNIIYIYMWRGPLCIE